MMMEAMRLSLLEHEAQQRREAEQRTQNGAEDGSSQPTTESQNSPTSPPTAESSSSDVASSTEAPTVTPPASNTPPPSSPLDLPNPWPNPEPLSESPRNDSGDLHPLRPSGQPSPSPSPSPTPRPPTVGRMDSLASSVSTHDTGGGLEGYRFLTSESEESVVAREPLLHVEDGDA